MSLKPRAESLIAMGLLLWSTMGQAATWEVNNRHPLAADAPASNSVRGGTPGAPFKSIQAALDNVQPGDTILVRAGTYRESLEWKTPGTATDRITLTAASGETVVVKGSIVVKDWVKVTPAEVGLSGAYAGDNIWVKRNWELSTIIPPDEPEWRAKDGRFWTDNPRQAFWKDAVLEGAGRLAPAFLRWELEEGRIFHDRACKALYIWLPAGVEPTKPGIEVCVRPLLLTQARRADEQCPLDYVTIRGIQFRHGTPRSLTNWPATGISGTGAIFEDNIVSWNDYAGFDVRGVSNIVRRCTFAYNGIAGMGGSGSGHLIEDNLVIGNNVDNYVYFNTGGGGKWVVLIHTTFRRHKALHNNGSGLWLDIECNDNLFENCEFSHNAGPGLDIEISRRNLVRNCTFAFNTARPSGYAIDHRGENQRWFATGGGGWGLSNRQSPGTRIYHCLFFGNAEGGLGVSAGVRETGTKDPTTGTETPATSRDVIAMNNILAENGSWQISMPDLKTSPEATGCLSDYNLLWGPRPIQAGDLAVWREDTGFEQHSLVACPEIPFGQAGFYAPPSTSPGVDAGTPVEECPVDSHGVARPIGKAPDIGPFERATVLGAEHRPAIPGGLSFTPLDLGALVNTNLNEWPPAGKDRTLQPFAAALPKDADGQPVSGEATFAGVPFRVTYPKSVVAVQPLRTDDDVVTIPINRKADWLFFLETSAGVSPGRTELFYRATYTDNQTSDIWFTGDHNVGDYAADKPDAYFDRERGTSTAIAWQGTATDLSHIAVFRLAWPNPRPDHEIATIEVWRNYSASAEHAILGLTAGSEKQEEAR